MYRIIAKTIMFISSYFPLYILLLILNFDKYNEMEELKNVKIIAFLITIIICIFVSILSLIFIVISKPSGKAIKIDSIERADDTIISYMMTYIIPILTTNLLDQNEMLVNIVLFLLIGHLYIRLNLLYLNPLWSIFGYLSYRVNSDVVIITNIKYTDLKSISLSQKELKGLYIGSDIFLTKAINK